MTSGWPHDYTPRVTAIARSIGRRELTPNEVEQLQDALQGYQWASSADYWDAPRSTHNRRRQQLSQIVQLCEQEEAEEVEIALNELDAPTWRLLGEPNRADLQDVKNAAQIALEKLQTRGPARALSRILLCHTIVSFHRPGESHH